ncbi:MAG: hypothetical protein DRP91_02555 [Candidatus Neomarinimicrobiota bacterium]|nr:MAG: hypothetical protein DRP91_02555 [Candidatus Neomarinimicrobiota bacterium]RKY54696.1 MAG: hypothetical protein DRP92_00300 [Candidatus Neomarinimicrobiota bacterium]
MGDKIVAIHQPNFLPWIGYFYKIVKSDIFVFLDSVQYTKNSFINRNKVKTSQGEMWLTVPVSFSFGQLIREVRINNVVDWRKKHLKTLEINYKKAKFFYEVFEIVEEVYYSEDWMNLSEFNICLIEKIMSYLGLSCSFVRSSSLGISGKGTELLVNIVKKVGGNVYLSGFGGAKYQEEKLFKNEGISLIYYDFTHPVYEQLWGNFIPNLSIIDLLFNVGDGSASVIRNSGKVEGVLFSPFGKR